MATVKLGIIGCGDISNLYLKNLTSMFNNVEVSACADLIREKAEKQTETYGIEKCCSVEALLSDPEIQIIVNLTIPSAHFGVGLAALNSGKHVYGEKPLAVTREDGQKVLELAEKKGLLVGCAPDTFLGAGLQTCRKLIDEGWIGKPVGAVGFMMHHGPESWHPNPDFFYQVGGGPMFDMGPYYITALISLIGPVESVTGSAVSAFSERMITSQPLYGKSIKVETPTHVTGVLEFKSGASATLITSFDVWYSGLPRIEIYGTEGSLLVPDPNEFRGPVFINRLGRGEWAEVPLTHEYSEEGRGIGVADMAYAITNKRQHRANGKMAYHVLDIMHGVHDAARERKHIMLKSSCDRPEALGMGKLAE
jgi:predicted dehydrogenase